MRWIIITSVIIAVSLAVLVWMIFYDGRDK